MFYHSFKNTINLQKAVCIIQSQLQNKTNKNPTHADPPKWRYSVVLCPSQVCRLSHVPGTRELLEGGTRVLLVFIFSLVSSTVPTHSTVLNKSHSAALSLVIWEGRGLCQRGRAFICFICASTFSFLKGFYCFKKTEKRKSCSVTTDLDNCQNVYENPELGLKMEVSGTTLYKVEVMSVSPERLGSRQQHQAGKPCCTEIK